MRVLIVCLLLMQGLALKDCAPFPQNGNADKTKPTSKSKEKSKSKSPGLVKQAAKYLARYGYATQDYADSDPTEDNMEGFLTNFQQFAHIPVTGRLDAATLKQMEEARCGMKDPKLKIKVKRTKRYTLYGTSWNDQLKEDRTLTWKVINSGRSFDVDTVRRIMSFALQKWSKVTNINFREETSGDADILVSFRSGPHDDFWPFDGRGGTLAHAFYPYPGAASSGDIHFDDDEEFTYGKSYGTDVLWVAVHEAGHSLGLEHSQVLDAVMYPWYRGSTGKDFDLRPDDIEGIRQLYGDRPVPTTVATKKPTTEATTPEPVTTAAPTTTGSTEPVRPPLPTTEATTPEPVTTAAPTTAGSTEPVRPPLPTSEATTPEPVTTAAPTTTGSTEPVRPPLPTSETITPEPVTTAASTTASGTDPVQPPLPTTEATTPEPVTTAAPQTVPIKTSSPVTGSPRSCPVTVDAAVLLRVGWLLIFSGDSFYLVSERGKEYGPIRVQEYFHGLKGKVTAAYKRNDDSVVLFVGNKYYVYYQFRLIEDAQPVTRYGLPADTVVEGALLWPGNRRSNWVQGDKVYLFAGKIYYRYDTRLKSIDRTYPRVISKLWRGLPDTISAAFSGNLYHNWKTHFFSNNQFYLYNDRIVNPYDGYPASLKLFLKC